MISNFTFIAASKMASSTGLKSFSALPQAVDFEFTGKVDSPWKTALRRVVFGFSAPHFLIRAGAVEEMETLSDRFYRQVSFCKICLDSGCFTPDVRVAENLLTTEHVSGQTHFCFFCPKFF